MEPTSYIKYDQNGLVHAYSGRENETPQFTWTCSTFEYFMHEAVTPSMLHFMQDHVVTNLSEGDMWAIQEGTYTRGHREAAAVDAYFATSLQERIDMHVEELVSIQEALRLARVKEADALNALLDENRPWDNTSSIDAEYTDFMRALLKRTEKRIGDLENELHEENNWFGGYERDAEFMV
jgi:hypothetical protein